MADARTGTGAGVDVEAQEEAAAQARRSVHDEEDTGTSTFIAYELWENPGFALEPASPRREWMDKFPHRVPYRCLPLNIANQAGWVVRSPVNFSVTWNGKHDLAGLKIDFADRMAKEREATLRRHIKSNFGGGIVTFAFPWLFRTPPGVGLWVRGPSNEFPFNARALDGLVETDWAHAPFTMNWKIEKRNTPAYFREGDALAVLTPFPLDLLEGLEPEIRPLESNPTLHEKYHQAAQARRETIKRAMSGGRQGFELSYMRGDQRDGGTWENHRTNLKLRAFRRVEGDD
jgi:hypothetical protein